jgi:MFS family permease
MDISQGLSEEDNAMASLSSLKDLGSLFWLITLLCVTLYGAVLPFNYIASAFLTETHFKNLPKIDAQKQAGIYMSVPFFICAFMVPIYGILIDKYGQRAYLSLLASVCGLICFIMFYLCPPIYGFIMLGLTYSMFAAVIWPAISLVVKKSLVGFAYGVTTSIQNAGLSIFPMFVAAIYSKSHSYYNTISFFLALMIASIFLSFILISVNNQNGGKIIL